MREFMLFRKEKINHRFKVVDIVEMAKKGDKNAIETLVNKYKEYLYKTEVGLVAEENGIKFSINKIMLDDRKLIFSMDVESSSIKWLFK